LESCGLSAVLCVVSSILRENKKNYSLIWFSFSRVVLFVSLSGFVTLPFLFRIQLQVKQMLLLPALPGCILSLFS
jgi:hypothetical protein